MQPAAAAPYKSEKLSKTALYAPPGRAGTAQGPRNTIEPLDWCDIIESLDQTIMMTWVELNDMPRPPWLDR